MPASQDPDRAVLDHLVDAGRLAPSQREAIIAEQRRRGGPARVRLGDLLVESGLVPAIEVDRVRRSDHLPAAPTPRPDPSSDPWVPAGAASASGAMPAIADRTAAPLDPSDAARIPPEVAPFVDAADRRIGRYIIVGEIGRGGMGIVYRAWDARLGRYVAVKTLVDMGDERRLKRFQREGTAAGRLRHPGIASIHEVGIDAGRPFLAMELVEGDSLQALLDRGALSPEAVARILREVARALEHAHEAGVVHRDIKPENIVVDARDGRPILIDFGIARDLHSGERLTRTGQAVGTPRFMAPEQLTTDLGPVGPAADIYAVGAVLYRALAGRAPFTTDVFVDLVRQTIAKRPADPRTIAPETPVPLAAIALRCLRKRPGGRYRSAGELAKDLERYLAGRPLPRSTEAALVDDARSAAARPATIAGAVLGLAVAAALTGALLLGGGFGADGSDPNGRDGVDRPPEDPTGPAAPPVDPDGWRRVFDLDDGRVRLARPALFEDGGRVAAPLAGLHGADPAALVAAFDGEVAPVAGGRTLLRYDLVRSARLRPVDPIFILFGGPPEASRLGRDGASVVALAPDNLGPARIRLGEALWDAPRIRLRFRAERLDTTALILLPHAAEPSAALNLVGREARVSVGGFDRAARLDFADAASHEVVWAPGAPPGERLSLDGRGEPLLDEVASAAAIGEPIELRVHEGRFTIEAVEVDGVPRRPDHPAIAWAPPELPASVRVRAAFRIERTPGDEDRPPMGGPFVALGDPAGGSFRAEVDRDRIVVSGGGEILTTVRLAAAPGQGELVLERQDDRLRVTLITPAGGRLTVEVTSPLPIAARVHRAGWGSTAPRVRFEAVTISVPPDGERADDPTDRLVADAAMAAGGRIGVRQLLLGAGPDDAVAAWRLGALDLASVASPAWWDTDLLGRPEASGARSAEAVARLEGAADRLEGAARDDALARGCQAAVLAGDDVGARRLALRLLGSDGDPTSGAIAEVDRARAAGLLDALERDRDGEPALLDRLASGFDLGQPHPSLALAATAVAEVVTPDRVAEVQYQRALAFRTIAGQQPNPDARRAMFEKALEHIETAGREGYEPGWRIDADAALILGSLERRSEALDRWEAAVIAYPDSWWLFQNLAAARLGAGRAAAALEAAIGALALAPARSEPRGTIARLTGSASPILETHPGLVAAGRLALDAVGAGRTGEGNLALASARRALRRGDGPDRDLGLYVLATGGEVTLADLPDAGRPTLGLARARLVRSDEATLALANAAGAALLVRHLARLDPILSPLLGQ